LRKKEEANLNQQSAINTNNNINNNQINAEIKQEVNNNETPVDINNNKKKSRGSRFRGVSRNGNQWQVLIMVNKKKRYVGSYSTEEEASKAYDKVCLQNHGVKAKTNYFYKEEEIIEIMNGPKLLKLE